MKTKIGSNNNDNNDVESKIGVSFFELLCKKNIIPYIVKFVVD